jgi:hypothetical protein
MGKSAPSAFNGALLSCDLNRETHRITRLLAKLNGTRHGTAAGIPSTRRPRPGVKSGKARAAALTPEQRLEIARLAVQVRWNKSRP